MQIEEQVNLARYTSLHVGGPARYFARAQSDADVLEALQLARDKQLPFMVLGKGSNTLFPDDGYPGVIIHMEDRSLEVTENRLTAASGVFMRQLVNFMLKHQLTGLEELAGIPGTVGGAIRGNAGTWSTETAHHLSSVDVLLEEQLGSGQFQVKTLDPAMCGFGYRSSRFKGEPRTIILRGTFTLQTDDAVAGALLVQKDLEERHKRQPYHAPSAGSIFKNPDKQRGIFSGALIEKVGLKGHQIGGAQFSEKHANFIININKATSQDIQALITLAQEKVWATEGIKLEPEIQIVQAA